MDQSTWAQGPALCSVEAEEGVGQNVGGTLRASACTHGLVLSGLRRPCHQETPVEFYSCYVALVGFYPVSPSSPFCICPTAAFCGGLEAASLVGCGVFMQVLLQELPAYAVLVLGPVACVNQNSQIRVAFQFTHHSPCLKALDRREPARKKI